MEIAAINSPGAVTIAGPQDAIAAFSRLARQRRVAVRVLDLAYPFHSGLLAPLREPLLRSLGAVAAEPAGVTFVSAVTGEMAAGEALDGEYWWRNVRETVRFNDAVAAAARLGATLFVEIGPRPILNANVADTLREAGFDGSVIGSLAEKDVPGDPLPLIAARAIVAGAPVDKIRVFGLRPAGRVNLPPYAWQRKMFQQPQTSEAVDLFGAAPRHPLIGARLAPGASEWRNLLDPALVPYLADHRIDGEIVVPGTAFAEMALAVARDIFPDGPIGLEDFDLLQWLPLPADTMREIAVRLSEAHVVEIWSRPRLGPNEWTLHARGRVVQVASAAPAFVAPDRLPTALTADQVYAATRAAGMGYGPSFQRVLRAERSETLIEIELSPLNETAGLSSQPQVLHPIALDAAFHAMFENIKQRAGERYAYLPVRFAGLRVDQDHGVPARARVAVERETDQSISANVTLYDAAGRFIAGLTGGLFRAVVLDRQGQDSVFFRQIPTRLQRHDDADAVRVAALAALADHEPLGAPESWLFLGAFARALAHGCLQALFGLAPVTRDRLAGGGVIAEAAVPLALTLFEHLRAAGLASETASGWVLAAESGLPSPG